MAKKTTPGKKVWLVTWESACEHAGSDSPVAAVFRPQVSAERVRDLVEFIYLSVNLLSDRLAYTLDPKQNPYPAIYGKLNGSPWRGEITCGANAWLRARLVDDFIIERNEAGVEKAVWKERKRPDQPTGESSHE